MAMRCRLVMGWAMAAAVVVVIPPAVAASDGVTNPVAERVQSETPVDVLDENPLRDPFWPVGYSPVTRTVSAAGADVTVGPVPVPDDLMQRALALIRVGGIIRRGSQCLASINGTMVEAGDMIPIQVDDHVVLFRVRSVDMKRVRLEPVKR